MALIITNQQINEHYNDMLSEYRTGRDIGFTWLFDLKRMSLFNLQEITEQVRKWMTVNVKAQKVKALKANNREFIVDNRKWYTLIVQPYDDGELEKYPMCPMALLLFGFGVCGYTYAFEKRRQRDYIYRMLNSEEAEERRQQEEAEAQEAEERRQKAEAEAEARRQQEEAEAQEAEERRQKAEADVLAMADSFKFPKKKKAKSKIEQQREATREANEKKTAERIAKAIEEEKLGKQYEASLQSRRAKQQKKRLSSTPEAKEQPKKRGREDEEEEQDGGNLKDDQDPKYQSSPEAKKRKK